MLGKDGPEVVQVDGLGKVLVEERGPRLGAIGPAGGSGHGHQHQRIEAGAQPAGELVSVHGRPDLANKPTGPHPSTNTVSPPLISVISAAWYPVEAASVSGSASRSSTSSGIFSASPPMKGTRTYSAWPPT